MRESVVMERISHVVLIIASLCALLPFVLLFIASFTDNTWALANGFRFLPKEWSLDAYIYIGQKWRMIGKAYLMTFLVTFLGTVIGLAMVSLFAYGISKTEIPGMKLLSFLTVFTMLFNGGLVATYYTYANIFPVRNTIWGLIVPNLLMNAFSVILVKNYYTFSVPASFGEAAQIDGASEFGIFFRIILPLSKPILATVGLTTALAYWNDWQNGLYYLSERDGSHLYTIQLVLNSINESINFLMSNSGAAMGSTASMPSVTVRMAIAALGILPIVLVYPFFQKYFVSGITLGGVKE